MKSFSYTGTTPAGKQVKGTINAEDEKDFMSQVNAKGLTNLKYEEKDIDSSKTIKKFSTKDLAFNCRLMVRKLPTRAIHISRTLQ